MSDQAVDLAVERILSDHDFARRVLEEGESALTGFDLTAGERKSIHWVVEEDVKDTFGEVQAFAGLDLGSVDFGRLRMIPSVKGQFDPGAEWATSWFCRANPGATSGQV